MNTQTRSSQATGNLILNAEIESKVHLAIHTKKITMNFKSSFCLEGIRAVCL